MHRFISIGCILLAACLLVLQVVAWQRTGHWPDYSVAGSLRAVGVPVPYFEWRGASRVVATFFGLPLALCLIVAALVVELVWGRRFR